MVEAENLKIEPKSARMITDKDNVSLMRQVGDKMGVRVIALVEEGQDYTSTRGYRGVVDKGKTYVEIARGDGREDLSRFWDEVKRLRSERETRQSKSLLSRLGLRR